MNHNSLYSSHINRYSHSHCLLTSFQLDHHAAWPLNIPTPAFTTGVSSCLRDCPLLLWQMPPKLCGMCFLWNKITTFGCLFYSVIKVRVCLLCAPLPFRYCAVYREYMIFRKWKTLSLQRSLTSCVIVSNTHVSVA